MPDENPDQKDVSLDPNAPPVSKGSFHNINARLAAMDAETRDLVEKAIADKVILERNLKAANEGRAKTEARLAEFMQKEQEEEKERLTQQGKYKELAEKAEADLKQLRSEMKVREVKDSLSRELIKHGAIDEELVAEGLMAKYRDELSAGAAGSLVERLKAEKPLLFKVEQKQEAEEEVQNAGTKVEVPPARSTGHAGGQPQPGTTASKFDALDPKNKIEDVEKMWKQATKNAYF